MQDDDEAVDKGQVAGDSLLPAMEQALRESPGLARFLEVQLGDLELDAAIGPLKEALSELASRALVLPESTKGLDVVGVEWSRVAEAVQSLEISPRLANIAEQLRLLDVGERLRGFEHWPTVADWSEQTFGFTALTSWRTSLAVDSRLERLVAEAAAAQLPQVDFVKDLSWITKAQVHLTDWVVQRDATSRILGEISGRPLGLWRGYVDSLPAEPDDRVLRTSVATGHVGLGLLGADVLESDPDDDVLVGFAVEQVETEILTPWQRGRVAAAHELYVRLGVIERTVPELLEGAWEEVERNGPAAASKAAHCCVEALDRTLRAAAPDDQVRAWHTAAGRPASEWDGRDKPTRTMRVKYLTQGGSDSARKLIVAQHDSLIKLVTPLSGRLEGIKHASTADVIAVRNLLLTTESFLAVLFVNTES